MSRQSIGLNFLILLLSSSLFSALAFPNSQQLPEYKKGTPQQINQSRFERKFAEKPNAIKKVALDDLDDIQTNEISQTGTTGGGFSWSNLLDNKWRRGKLRRMNVEWRGNTGRRGTGGIVIGGMVMQMIFNPGGAATGPNKSESLDDGTVPTSPWANLLSVGLKILTAILGGGAVAQSDGIDKVDNGGSPLQGVLTAVVSTLVGGRDPQQVNMLAKQASEFINIVVNLLDALKTSFSHRSLAARNIGKKDSLSDAAVAGIAMAKGYVRSLGTDETSCMAKYMCQANNECTTDIGQSSLFCHLGSYAASFVLDKSASQTTFDSLYEAGRRGRSGSNCEMGYLECNEVY